MLVGHPPPRAGSEHLACALVVTPASHGTGSSDTGGVGEGPRLVIGCCRLSEVASDVSGKNSSESPMLSGHCVSLSLPAKPPYCTQQPLYMLSLPSVPPDCTVSAPGAFQSAVQVPRQVSQRASKFQQQAPLMCYMRAHCSS
jgi:hypothetical protein